MEPLLDGDMPAPRKGATAAATAGTVVMFGGWGVNAEEQPVLLGELVLMEVQAPGSLRCLVAPAASGDVPCARSNGVMTELEPGKLFLYGGFNAEGKPLDDAYVFEVEHLTWRRVYNGHPDLVGPQGETARNFHGQAMLTGVPVLDRAAFAKALVYCAVFENAQPSLLLSS
jgi:hypothetical protein